MTLKQLKDFIKDLPDDLPVVVNDFIDSPMQAETVTIENGLFCNTKGIDETKEYLSINS